MRIAAAALVLVGCASTGTATYSNPDFAGHRFEKTLVYARLDDPGARRQMEDALVAGLRHDGIAAYSALAVWPLDAGVQTQDARLAQYGIDSVLVVEIDGTGRQLTAPAATGAACPRSYGNPYAAMAPHRPASGGYRPYAAFTVRLVDVTSKRDAWVDQAEANGTGKGFNAALASFVDQAAGDLVAANVLAGAKR